MKRIVLVTGGCRSGKSSFALDYAVRHFSKRTYLATCEPLDEEMSERIRRHKETRGPEWRTIEEPLYVAEAVSKESAGTDVILLDCLTMWVSNMVVRNLQPEEVFDAVEKLVAEIQNANCSQILVTNEVGAGIVPDNTLARLFRDIAGAVNQKIAVHSDEVYLMVAGIPVRIK